MPSTTEISKRRDPAPPTASVAPASSSLDAGRLRSRGRGADDLASDTMPAVDAARPQAGASTEAPWWPGQERQSGARSSRAIGAAGLGVVALGLTIGFLARPDGTAEPTTGAPARTSAEADASVGGQPSAPTSAFGANAGPPDASAEPAPGATAFASSSASAAPKSGSGSPRPGSKARPPAYRYR
jgi:hypothetical protein